MVARVHVPDTNDVLNTNDANADTNGATADTDDDNAPCEDIVAFAKTDA